MLNPFRRRPKNIYLDTSKKGVSHKNNTVFNRRGIIHFIIGEGLCIILILGLIFCALQFYRYMTTSNFFNIKKINIVGINRLTKEDITSLLNIHPGMNSLSISISDMEKKLYANPWISSVSIKRHLPDTFEIQINEKKAAFWIRQKDTLYYSDIEGNIIAPVQMKNFISLPTLEVSKDGEALRKNLGQLLYAFKETKLSIDSSMISLIRLTDGKHVEIIVGDQQVTFIIQAYDWTMNLLKLNAVLHDLAARGELKSIQEIWVSDGNAWTVKKKIS